MIFCSRPHLLTAVLAVGIVCLPSIATGQNRNRRSRGPRIEAVPGNTDGVYAIGETIHWDFTIEGENAELVSKLTYQIKSNGMTVVEEGELDVDQGKAELSTQINEQGTILVELRVDGSNRRKLVGATAAPEKIQPAAARPDDFDTFWENKIAELATVPANPRLESIDSEKENVEYFKIQMDNVQGSQIYGQIAKPSGEKKLPALLIVQWAGVYGLPKDRVTNKAADGWLTLNIMPHDLPFDKPATFYNEMSRTKLRNYAAIGADNRETSYFLRMYLSCYRAAQYLSERDDWDGKTLVVMGDSQGGQQSIVTAGLHPKITAMMPLVPSGNDVASTSIGRASAFPGWDRFEGDQVKIMKTAAYFDAANFASRITCPSLVGMGLIDETCPPSTIFAACNQIKAPLEMVILENSPHQNRNGSQVPYQRRRDEWLKAMLAGEAPPVQSYVPKVRELADIAE